MIPWGSGCMVDEMAVQRDDVQIETVPREDDIDGAIVFESLDSSMSISGQFVG
jgi:hypothetical protein